jgi:hypothetical protein
LQSESLLVQYGIGSQEVTAAQFVAIAKEGNLRGESERRLCSPPYKVGDGDFFQPLLYINNILPIACFLIHFTNKQQQRYQQPTLANSIRQPGARDAFHTRSCFLYAFP